MRQPAERCTVAAALLGLVLGLLALGPGLGRGFLLTYDMVFVPSPAFNQVVLGGGGVPPRAVPSDLVIAVLDRALPAQIVQKLVLLSVFVLAAAGAAALLRGGHWLGRLAAAVMYAWNPFVAERLLLGQWALLLGYAALPWVVRAMATGGTGAGRLAARLALALVPAAIGGFAPLCVTAPVIALMAALAPGASLIQRARRVGAGLAVLAAASLPWLVPALAHPVHTSAAGVAAFAPRADTPFGAAGSLLMLGGVWNGQTVPTGYGGYATVGWLAVVLAGIGGFAALGRRRWPGLGPAAAAGLLIAGLGIWGQGQAVLRGLIGLWPGFAVLRDGQQFVAPLAVAEAAGLGLAVTWMLRSAARLSRDVRVVAAVAITVLPVLTLPGLGWGAAGRLTPVQYPAAWLAARQLIDRSAGHGKVLLLPWAAYRRYPWNDGRPLLDPWPRLLAAPVLWNDAVQVGALTVPSENPGARALTPLLASARPLTARLLAMGVRIVIVDANDSSGAAMAVGARQPPWRARLPGCRLVLRGAGLLVYRLPDRGPAPPGGAAAARAANHD